MSKWIQKKPQLNYRKKDDLITKIAKINGIEDINSFLNPTEKFLHKPKQLNNIDKATDRIIKAIHNNELISISADIDADGLCGCVSLYRYLREFTNNLYYMYHQRDQGHGIENQTKEIKPNTKLLIIVDSSTNSTKACREITEEGIDIVIFDHHTFTAENEYATIVNPQLDNYPNKELSGAGVVWKSLKVLDEKLNSNLANKFIDLTACGLFADIMSMKKMENRYIISEGLKNIINPGLKAILAIQETNLDKLSTKTIGFGIAPFINGVTRIGQIELALDLLLEDNFLKCNSIAYQIQEINDKRRIVENKLVEQIKNQVNEDDKVIIAINENKAQGKAFNGLIANKIANMYKRPCIIVNEDGNQYKGSFRSLNIDFQKIIKENIYMKFLGGHKNTGGVAFIKDDLEEIKECLNEEFEDIDLEPTYYYDLELTLDQIDKKLIGKIENFNKITGKDFEPIKFVLKDIFINDRKVLGKNKNTIKFQTDEDLEIIKFMTEPDWRREVDALSTIDAIGELNLNQFRGKITPQLIVDDVKESS